jgi:flagellar hook assembly protein FlgD
MNGEVVVTLQDGLLTEGGHRITWNGKNSFGQDVPQGIYLLRLVSGSSVQQKTIVKTQ